MPDRERVIEGLEDTAGYFRHLQSVGFFGDQPVFREHEAHCNDALALLKEQEPKKIIRKQMSYEDPDGSITYYAEWHCPHCDKVVQKGFDSPWLKYCFNCGKPILWDQEQDEKEDDRK